MIGYATSDEAYAACMQNAPNVADCRREVADHMVNGAWCDGDVYLEAGKPPRCIPSTVLAAKLAAEAKNPLPATQTPKGLSAGVYLAIGAAGLGLLYLAFR